MNFASFDSRREAGRAIAPDFRVLVALLAASQAAQPTARLATRLDMGGDGRMGVADQLVALFAPRRGGVVEGGALRGSFNPAVPFSDTTITWWKDA